MHANNEDNLNEFERRLTQWRPATEGLDSDALLYQAGMQAGRNNRTRSLWPTLCLLLAIASTGLGLWGLNERAKHQALSLQLREQTLVKKEVTTGLVLSPASYVPSSNDYFQLRRLADQDPARWLQSLQSISIQTPAPSVSPNILQPRQFERLRDQ